MFIGKICQAVQDANEYQRAQPAIRLPRRDEWIAEFLRSFKKSFFVPETTEAFHSKRDTKDTKYHS